MTRPGAAPGRLPGWTGAAATVVVIAALEALAAAGLRVPNPPAFVLFAVVFAAFSGGTGYGLLSAGIAWLYFAWSFSLPGAPFRYSPENYWRVVIWAFATPGMALLVGRLKRDADRAAVAQAEARASNAALEALRQSESRYKAVAEIMVEGILILKEGRFVYANPGALQLLGYAMHELQGRPFAPLIHPDFRDLVADRHRRRSAGEALPPRYDIRVVRKSGAPIWVQIANERIDWEGGPAVLTVISDITERKTEEEKVRDLNVELERRVTERTAQLSDTVKELDSFCYTISHDLRAPLRALNSYARIVLAECAAALPRESRRHLEQIEKNALHMGELLDDLLDFARLGRVALREEDVGMDGLARDVVAELAPAAADGRAAIRVAALPDCRGDPALLRQVWRNLVSNALKYSRTREPPAVEIGFDAARGAYFVRDNGVGFDMQYAGKLFGVFSRLHASSEFEGTGVGLAIVQRVIQRHGGRVWAESAPEKGATFYFSLA